MTITVADLQILRQIEAERASLAKECEELKQACEKSEESAKQWQEKYEQEKYRADIVQEKRIEELLAAFNEKSNALGKLSAANLQLHDQHKNDRQEIANLQFDNRKLKGDRWRWGAAGFALGGASGFAGGFYIGNKSKDTNILFGGKGGLADNRLASFQF